MKLLTTLYASYLTGDDLADAVMEYGLALYRRRDVDMVTIPVIDGDGTRREAQFMIGWQSDVGSTTQAESLDELLDPATVAALRSKAAVGVHAEPFGDRELEEQLWPSFD